MGDVSKRLGTYVFAVWVPGRSLAMNGSSRAPTRCTKFSPLTRRAAGVFACAAFCGENVLAHTRTAALHAHVLIHHTCLSFTSSEGGTQIIHVNKSANTNVETSTILYLQFCRVWNEVIINTSAKHVMFSLASVGLFVGFVWSLLLLTIIQQE